MLTSPAGYGAVANFRGIALSALITTLNLTALNDVQRTFSRPRMSFTGVLDISIVSLGARVRYHFPIRFPTTPSNSPRPKRRQIAYWDKLRGKYKRALEEKRLDDIAEGICSSLLRATLVLVISHC